MSQKKPESFIDSVKRAGRFAKDNPSSVEALQKFGRKEAEKKKVKGKIDTSPSKETVDSIMNKPKRKKGDDIHLPFNRKK